MVNYTPKRYEDHSNPFEGTIDQVMDKKYVSFHQKASIEDAIKKMLRADVTGAPVIDDDNRLVGYLSQRDCLKQATQMRYLNEQARLVEDYMGHDLVSFHFKTNIFHVIQSFIDKWIHAYPITDDQGKVIGVITRHKMLSFVNKQNQTAWKKSA